MPRLQPCLRGTFFGMLLLTLSAPAHAQTPAWTPTNGPYGGPVKALLADRAGNLFAGTDYATYRSTNSGDTWTWCTSLSPGGKAFVADSAGTIFAGDNGVWRSTDAGLTWEELGLAGQSIVSLLVTPDNTVFAGVNGPNQRGVFRLFNTDSATGSAAGQNGSILRTTKGEPSWIPHGLSGQTAYILLFSQKHGLLATVGWSSVRRGSLVDTAWLQIGSTSSRPHTFVEDTAGNLYVGLEIDGVDASTDGGATWHRTGLDRPYTVRSLAALPTGEMYAGVYPLDPSIDGGAYKSTDGGTTWTWLGLPESGIYAVLARDQSTVFLGSSRGIYRSITGGDNWDVACEGIAAAENRALLCLDQSTLFAGSVAGLFRSTDDGESWHESGQGISPPFITSLACDASGNLFAGNMVFSPKGGIYKSADRGETWRNTSRDSIRGMYTAINSIIATTLNVLVAGVDDPYRIVRSVDGGETWSRAVTPRSVSRIATDSAGILYGATWGYGVLRSTDDGQTWNYTGPGLPNLHIECIAARDKEEVFAGGIGGVSRSTDGGDSWIHMTGSLGAIIAKAIAIGDEGVIIVSTTDKRVFRTTDDGQTWTMDTIRPPTTSSKIFSASGSMDSGPSVQFIRTFAGKGGRMFGADTIGYVFRYQGSTTAEESRGGLVPATVKLEQNYPNPFNPSTVVRYHVPAAGHVRLVVFDLLGREVAALVDEKKAPGSCQVTFKASGLASGVYLYRLTAGTSTQTRKMLLLR